MGYPQETKLATQQLLATSLYLSNIATKPRCLLEEVFPRPLLAVVAHFSAVSIAAEGHPSPRGH